MLERLRSLFESRGAATSPWGKLDDWLEGCRIESFVKQKFLMRAAEAGKPASEFMRDIVRVVALGPEEVKRVYQRDVDAVSRMLGAMPDRPRQ